VSQNKEKFSNKFGDNFFQPRGIPANVTESLGVVNVDNLMKIQRVVVNGKKILLSWIFKNEKKGPTNDPKTPQDAPRRTKDAPKTPLDAPKTPYFDYNLYNFSEMKKSISPKTHQNAQRRPKTS